MNIDSFSRQLDERDLSDYGPDFLLTWDHNERNLSATLILMKILKEVHKQQRSFSVFDDGLAVSIFRDKSTRTRFSFASAANGVGLAVSDLDEEKSQIAHGETVRETANMISFMTRVIGIRDDMYLGAGQTYMREVARAVQQGFEEGVLHQRPGMINLQCDIDHPTQSMSDLAMLEQHFGGFENLQGKRVAMSWAYSPSYGKPLSVPQGIVGLLTRYGMDVVLAHPPGYGLLPDVVERASTQASTSRGSFQVVNDMAAAFENADVVYPKSWAPFQVMEQRTELLRARDHSGLKDLEKKCLEQNALFQDWECNADMMSRTRGGDALYMHCLPADISGVSCVRGEVSEEVFEKQRRNTYLEAGYKPFVIASMMILTTNSYPRLRQRLSELSLDGR